MPPRQSSNPHGSYPGFDGGGHANTNPQNLATWMPQDYANPQYVPQASGSGGPSGQMPMMPPHPGTYVPQGGEDEYIHEEPGYNPEPSDEGDAGPARPNPNWDPRRRETVTASKDKKAKLEKSLVGRLKDIQRSRPDIFGLICAPNYRINGAGDAVDVAIHIINDWLRIKVVNLNA